MKKECIYIAGPECFYENGTLLLDAMRRLSESQGFDVSLPNDTPLKLDHADLRKNADTIFENCCQSMLRSTAIIADLEFYRGPEPDGGTIYELGMAYARGIRCYGYARDRRTVAWTYQGSELREGRAYDRKGRPLPYQDLPFSPNVVGSTKILQGDYRDCLQMLMVDLEEERKLGRPAMPPHPPRQRPHRDRPLAYLAGPDRYAPDAAARYEAMARQCRAVGLDVVTPLDDEEPLPADPYGAAYAVFRRNCRHVEECDLILADLNDFHGWEPDSDTSFECGYAFQLGGRKLYGYMEDVTIMKQRVPSLGPDRGWRDIRVCNVENFGYPINLMFASPMHIYGGSFERILPEVLKDIQRQ